MILYNFGDDKIESFLNFYSKILCRVSGLINQSWENFEFNFKQIEALNQADKKLSWKEKYELGLAGKKNILPDSPP